VAALATQAGWPLYLVGGSVRDCLLGLRIGEFDLTVEGDPTALAQAIARDLHAKLILHDRFGTAKLTLPDRSGVIASIDLAMARTETYAQPGALPHVTRGTLATDLIRRDFTINALALRLDGDHFGALIDVHGGVHDLDHKIVRVLQARSFVDDPTRLFRGARFEQRFDFALAADTSNLIPAARPVIDQVSGDRLRHEIEWLFKEARPDKPLARLDEWGVLRQVDADLIVDAGLRAQFRRHSAPYDRFTCWAWLLAHRSRAALERIMQRLNLNRDDALDLGQLRELLGAQAAIGQAAAPSAIDRQLNHYHDRALRAALTMIEDEAARDHISRYLDELRGVRLAIDGARLQAWGLPPGPAIGRTLDALRAATLDGLITTPEQAEAYAHQLIGREIQRDRI
jgi:tRNA nucleotidyltransferase (CCA-adding enzyme)